VIESPGEPLLLIEIKSKDRITVEDAKVIERLGPVLAADAEQLLLSQDSTRQLFGKARALHWQDGLRELFRGSFPEFFSE